MTSVSETLRPRWLAHVAALGGVDDAVTSRLFDGLCSSYAEPHRAYHTLAHVGQVLDLLEASADGVREPLRLAFAAWYHDVVYDPRAPDNEERSAARASVELGLLGADAAFAGRVARLIVATKHDARGGADADDDLFLDADFAILAAPAETYARYAAQVRREFAHVADDAWRSGRGAFLTAALSRPRVFLTEAFERRHGAQARANMAAELGRLEIADS